MSKGCRFELFWHHSYEVTLKVTPADRAEIENVKNDKNDATLNVLLHFLHLWSIWKKGFLLNFEMMSF